GEIVTYIEVTLDDIALANRLAHEVLGRSLDDVAPQTRRLLGHVDDLVRTMAATDDVSRSEALDLTCASPAERCASTAAGRRARSAPTSIAW
ncbi:MAG: hypothetical protein ACRD0S_13835, partial [Acidimicrobiales bacterium]